MYYSPSEVSEELATLRYCYDDLFSQMVKLVKYMSFSELTYFLLLIIMLCFLLLLDNLSELDSRYSYEFCELVHAYDNICLTMFYFKSAVNI